MLTARPGWWGLTAATGKAKNAACSTWTQISTRTRLPSSRSNEAFRPLNGGGAVRN